MTGNMTIEEWAAKADYEGGITSAFEYGLVPDDLKDWNSEFYILLNDVYRRWVELDDSRLMELYDEALEAYAENDF